MPIAGIAEASSPTGEVTDLSSESGGWKPITAYSLRRHSGSGLSGKPPSEPFSFLKRATRFIISAFVEVRIVLQSFISSLQFGVKPLTVGGLWTSAGSVSFL